MEKKTIALGNGTTLAFLERPGGDIPLVLLHGITNNARPYEPLLDGISADCHVYAVDFRGHGESSKPDTLYDTEAYAEDIRCFLREKAGTPALLAGHSLGGMVTTHSAATSPELVRRIFLEDPPLYFVGNLNEIYKGLFEGMVTMSTTLRDGSRSRAEWVDVMANAPDPYSGRPGLETMGEARINMRLDSLEQMLPRALRKGEAPCARLRCHPPARCRPPGSRSEAGGVAAGRQHLDCRRSMMQFKFDPERYMFRNQGRVHARQAEYEPAAYDAALVPRT